MIHPTVKAVARGFLWFLLMIAMFVAVGLILTSCSSKSGRLDQIQSEKVVVLDSKYTDVEKSLTYYKVKRLEYGVVTFVLTTSGYEIGDTILYKFVHP